MNKKEKALEHMFSLFNLAKKEFPSPISKRYIELLRSYGMRNRLHIPKEIKRNICTKCNSLLIPGKNCSVRLKPGHTRIITCLDCGHIKRIGYTKSILKNTR